MRIQTANAHLSGTPLRPSASLPNPQGPVDTFSTSDEPGAKWGILRPVKDAAVITRLLGIGQLYRMKGQRIAAENEKNPPLQNEVPVLLEQPLVMVPGWTTTRKAFDPLAEKLVEGGRNGGQLIFVSQGNFFYDRDCTQRCDDEFLHDAQPKVFEMVWSDVRLPPNLSSVEMVDNMRAVKELAGVEKVDVSAYSMGGLATRAYLDNGGNDIDQVLFLGSPHRGAKFADLARYVLKRDIGWAVSFAGLLPADLPSFEWLAPEEEGNQILEGLNQRWPQQKALVREAEFVGGTGTVTADGGWWPITDGDGLVSKEAVAPPGEEPILIADQHHSHLNNSAPVYREMQAFFGWKPD